MEKSPDQQISLTDRDARAMTGRHGRLVGYNVQIGVDSKHKLIVAAQATQARADSHQLACMGKKAKQVLEVDKLEVVADKGYYDQNEILACIEDHITPTVPRVMSSTWKVKGLFPKSDFTYDSDNDCYTCPNGAILTPYARRKGSKSWITYRTNACGSCVLRGKCTTSKRGRCLSRSPQESHIEAWELACKKSGLKQDIRRNLVEHPFGIIKTAMQSDTFLTKGLHSVQTELNLTALAYNLKRIFNLFGTKILMEAL